MTLKNKVRKLLDDYDREGVVALALDDRRVVPALNRLIFDMDELTRWRAAEAMGWLAEAEPFLLDKIIARLIYTMNDDSGSIGWMAPQALGEICVGDPDLVEDFFPIVKSSIELDVFRPGAVRAVGRVAPVRPDMVDDMGPVLIDCLDDPEPEVRGLAAWALGRIGWLEAGGELRRAIRDQATFSFYWNGRLERKTVGRMAESALAALAVD
jgi:HEAT repeat protein